MSPGAGLDPQAFSGHSLGAGFLTSAAGNGAPIFKLMDLSRHRSIDTLRGYIRDAVPGSRRGRTAVMDGRSEMYPILSAALYGAYRINQLSKLDI